MSEQDSTIDFGKRFYAMIKAGVPLISVATPEEQRFFEFMEDTLHERTGIDVYWRWCADLHGRWEWKDAHYEMVDVQAGNAATGQTAGGQGIRPIVDWLENHVLQELSAPGNAPVVAVLQDAFDTMMTANASQMLVLSRCLKRVFARSLLRARGEDPTQSPRTASMVFVEGEAHMGGSHGREYTRGGWPFSLVPYIEHIDFPRPDSNVLMKEVRRAMLQQGAGGASEEAQRKVNKARVDKRAKRAQKVAQAQVDAGHQKARTMVSCGLGLTADQFFLAARQIAQELPEESAKGQNRFDLLEPVHFQKMNEAKHEIIRSAAALEVYPYTAKRAKTKVIGLDHLRTWLDVRRDAFLGQTKKPVPVPTGIMLIGYPGTGKSTTAKFVSQVWNIGLVRLDLGRVLNPYVGEAEAALRRALEICERVAPIVLWIDEVEKGWGSQGRGGDSGVTQRLLGNFIIWQQEHVGRVFVVATCNDLGNIPPEFHRRGRFDEVFFVGLPSAKARLAILLHMIELHWTLSDKLRKGFKDYMSDEKTEFWKAFEPRTCFFTGAELEAAVKHLSYSPAYLQESEDFSPRRMFGPGGSFYDELGISQYKRFYAQENPLAKYERWARCAGEHEKTREAPAQPGEPQSPAPIIGKGGF
jgi:hypothetical protein